MIFNSKDIIKPFWAEGGSFLGGRDPLGIQNSSIVVYSNLLPGMTNLTGRIRYYSFYCWLLAYYDKCEKSSTDNQITQYTFIRRAELAMAFLMKDTTATNIVGRDYVSKPSDDIVFDIAKGADNPNSNSYWKYTSGALGQYYAGSLVSLGLIEISDKYFCITDAGRKLAVAYCNSTDNCDREDFLKIIKVGSIDCSQNNLCKSLYINLISRDSEEWEVLNHILFSNKDNKREETRVLFQKALIDGCSVSSFPLFVYQKAESTIDSLDIKSAEFGWIYYYLNEAIHYSLSTIFWMFLSNIDKPCPVDSYIERIVNKVSGINIDISQSDIPQLLDKVKSCIKDGASYQAIDMAIALINKIDAYIQPHREKIDYFENHYCLKQQSGHILESLDTYSKRAIGLKKVDYIRMIIKSIATTHTTVAYRKMGKGDGNLQKFMIEDGVIYRVETVFPQHTSPRLGTLYNFLLDLGYITAKEKA